MQKNKINQFSRTELLLGADGVEKLKQRRVAVFGVGGVGGFVIAALARAGVGELDIIDNDIGSLSNINRQIIADHKTIGKPKTEVMKSRILDINPSAKVNDFQVFYNAETSDSFDFSKYDYVVDAIDTVTGKLLIIENADKFKVPVISSMGTGNKLDPTRFEVTDIYKTSVCPLARVMRRELKSRGIKKLKVVYSKEEPVSLKISDDRLAEKKGSGTAPGSVSFVPSAAGLIIAGEVVKDLVGMNNE